MIFLDFCAVVCLFCISTYTELFINSLVSLCCIFIYLEIIYCEINPGRSFPSGKVCHAFITCEVFIPNKVISLILCVYFKRGFLDKFIT